MKQKFDILDESIKHLWLESQVAGERSKEEDDLQRVLNENYTARMTSVQRERMQARLLRKNTPSFGTLLQSAIKGIASDLSSLASKTGLLPSQMEDLVQDKIPVNSVPVVFLRNLLTTLNIPFSLAYNAILKTFDNIKERESQLQIGGTFSPSFKRNREDQRASSSMLGRSSELYDNEEAIQQYLDHLKKLM